MSNDDEELSGPYCRHWGDPAACEIACARCGVRCGRHAIDIKGCAGWVDVAPTVEVDATSLIRQRQHVHEVPTIRTHRGLPVLLSHQLFARPTLTVELHTKWYGLILLTPVADSITVEEIPFPDEPDVKGPPYVDHVPNPAHVRAFAERLHYVIPTLAWALICGCWAIERGVYAADDEETYRPPEER